MNNWIKGVDYPEWMVEEGLKTLQRQHLLDGETPKQMYERVTYTLAKRLSTMTELLDVDYIQQKWFSYLWKGWLSPATPILANVGTDRGLGISCFISRVPDSLDGIYNKLHEMAMLTKAGGGVGVSFDKIRGRGEVINTGGFSEGTIPFMKVYDSGIIAANQGNIRRGAASINLPVRHKDIDEFLRIRIPEGDVNRQCLNLNHCVTIDDFFMEDVIKGNRNSRETYSKILSSRMKTGQPYVFYYHNVNKFRPEDFKKRNLKIDGTNICTEIMLPHNFDHTVVCDLASLNMSKYDEWKDDETLIELALLFLDVNLEEFIELAKDKIGFECAVRFAKKSRALGLGVLGWHTYLQSKNIPFISIAARSLIHQIGKKLKSEGAEYNQKYGKILGNPEWCDSNRNTTLFAIAPTTTTSLILGGVSQGIEPVVANSFVQKSAKGTFIRKNKHFEELIKTKYPEHNNETFWSKLAVDLKGSVQSLDFLSDDEKEVFLTAYEINQLELIKNAAVWQTFIDQGISLNLFFPADVEPKWFSKCHITAWEEGIKSLYYVRTESILSRNMNQNTFNDCVMCEG
jgi:ribonucleoside-diphosphate reductase alpha chain